MKIALVAPSMEVVGGHAVQARAIAHGLQQDGHEVLFVPVNPTFHHRLRRLRQSRYVRTAVNEALYLPMLLRLRQAEVVHIFAASYWSFVLAPLPAMLAARRFEKRVILHYHSGEAQDHLSRWGRVVHRWLRLADEIVVPSEFLRGVFARFGYQVRVIPNVIEPFRFRYRDRHPLRPRLLSNRSLEPSYRVANTLRAFAMLRTQCPDATLMLAGSGSQHSELSRLATLLGDRGVRFVGSVTPEAMPAVYDTADIFVNSSVVDNQPVSILEAFAAGLSVVSTSVGDVPHMLREGECGVLVPPDDAAALARALTALVADPAGARRRARQALLEVERYTWPAVRDAWEAVYAGPAVVGRR